MKGRESIKAGLTVVELLVTVAILSIVLGVLGNYFAGEVRTFRQVNAKTNAQDKARFIMAVVGQDLQMAGADRYVAEAASGSRKPTGLISVPFNPCSASNKCVSTATPTNTVKDSITSRYITSLRPSSESCRRVTYSFAGNVLNRSDVGCATASPAPSELAREVLALNVQYICSFSGSNIKDVESDCDLSPSGTPGFVKSARIAVYVASDSTTPSGAGSFDIAGTAVNCPANRFCIGLIQEVPTPNLKPK